MKKTYILFFLFFALWTYKSNGQVIDTSNSKNYSEILPQFPGGETQMFKLITDSMKYPQSAIDDKLGGFVVVTFIIDTIGNVSDIKVIQSVRSDLDKEAIRLAGLLKGWTPGSQFGKKVKVQFNLPIPFIYNNKSFKKKKDKN